MAFHARKQIRDAVVTAVTGLTTTGSNVFNSYPYDAQPADLPALKVMTPSESVDLTSSSFSGGVRKEMRQLTVEVAGYAKGSTVHNTLDTIATEVEDAIMGDGSLAALVKDVYLTETEIEIEQADERVGQVIMRFVCWYKVANNATSSILT